MKILSIAVADIIVERDDRQRHVITDLDDLKRSLSGTGLIHPIIVRKDNRLVAGERRLSAAKALGWTHIDVRLWEELDDVSAQIVELEENIKRSNISWQENCEAVARIHGLHLEQNPKWTKEETAKTVGVTTDHLRKLLTINEAAKSDPKLFKAPAFITAFNINTRRQSREVEKELDLISRGTPKVKDKESFSILNADFAEWAETFEGERFNLIHCDFPYGISYQKSKQSAVNLYGAYEDDPDVYWALLRNFAKAQEKVIAFSAHLIFWFSMNYYTETLKFFKEETDFIINPFPLVWHKSDGKGLIPDPQRYGRRVYETALFGSRGDRLIVKATTNAYAAPSNKIDALHTSEKPESVLRHFFQMTVDNSTRLLDPTCGSGSAVRAAAALGAEYGLGVEISEEFTKIASGALAKSLAKEKMASGADLAPVEI